MQFSKLLSVLALPALTLAAASLGDIEPLPSKEVSPGCFTQYNAPIDGCTISELKSKKCTPECVTDLSAHATDVIVVCRLAFVGPNTLLRTIMDGGLVGRLCQQTMKEEDEVPKDEEEDEVVSTTMKTSTTKSAASPTQSADDNTETGDALEEDGETVPTETEEEEGTVNTSTVTGARTSKTAGADEEGDILDDTGAAGKNVVVGWLVGMGLAVVALMA